MDEMHEKSDAQLLRGYAQHGDEAAFREIVTRHTDLVYSAAVRCVNSPDLACDIAQSVFTDLSSKARPLAEKLADGASLVGWLYRSTRFAALNQLRNDHRRLAHERQAMEQLLSNSETAPDWDRIRPVLDEAMDNLSDEDRDALLLRYFKNHGFRDVGLALGLSDDAAQKRVSRAVERLREFFAKRGVTAGASGLVVVISANAVQAAPAGLAVTISTSAALAGGAVQTSTALAATKAIAMTTVQKTIIGATLAAVVSTGIYEARQNFRLREQNQALQQQRAPWIGQIQRLTHERDDANSKLDALQQENEQLRRDTAELAKLRGEIARLRNDSRDLAQLKAADTQKNNDPMESAAKALLGKMNLLKQRLEQMPDKNIPELQYLDASVWARIAQTASLGTDEGVRQALSELRDIAKQIFAPEMGKALHKFVQANNGRLPTDILQLKPYFESLVDDATLARYQVIRTGNVSDLQPDEMIVAEKAAVDDEHDNLFEIGLNSRRSHGVGKNAGNSSSGRWTIDPPQTQTVGK